MHAEKHTKIPNLTVHNNKIKIPKAALQHLQNVPPLQVMQLQKSPLQKSH